MTLSDTATQPKTPAKKVKVVDNPFWALLLNALMPGLGHILWREFLFGIFIFLVCLLAVIVFVVSLFVPLSGLGKALLLGLPALFYVFTFFDVYRTTQRRRTQYLVTRRRVGILLLIGLAYQLLAPVAPGNFALRNAPEFYTIDDNSLSPLFRDGDLVMASSLAYFVDPVIFDQLFVHSIPDRYDIVRYTNESGQPLTGMVVGLPNEEVAIVNGVIIANEIPYVESRSSIPLAGDWPLTYAGGNSILVAEISLSSVTDVRPVPILRVVGQVSKVL